SSSAIGFYGERGDEELTESSPPGNDFLARVCQAWEGEAVRAADLGVRVVRMRTGIVLAGAGGALEKMLPPFRLGVGGRLGSGRQWWSWIHLEDLVSSIEFLMTGRHEGAFNLTSPRPARQADFARVLGRVLGRPAVVPTPAFVLRAGLGGFAEELLSSKKVLPRRLEEAGYRPSFAELPAALENLLGNGQGAASTR
ncbi:MAG: TIGR01777 family oxidoreductase, partial [Acidobacteriota bacterium]|nr:TIGR01777 family oxidoreductase [Acidobacteriota bacterium]